MPPSGPGDAGHRHGHVRAEPPRAPSAIAAATSADTAPCVASSSAGTSSSERFTSSAYATMPPTKLALEPGHVGEPRGDHAPGARLGGREPETRAPREREHELLDPPLVAREEPALEPLREPGLERVGALLGPGLDDEVDMDLELARADRRLDAVTVAAGLLERSRDGRLADAEQPQHAPSGRPRPRSSSRIGSLSSAFGHSRRSSLGGPGRMTTTQPVGAFRTSPGAVPARPSERAETGTRRLLRHARREVRVRPPEPLRDRARDRLDLPLERLVDDELEPRRTRDELHGSVVVGRAEPAGDEARVGLQTLAQHGLELGGGVADDRDPRPARARG